jgi:hypothetical protein
VIGKLELRRRNMAAGSDPITDELNANLRIWMKKPPPRGTRVPKLDGMEVKDVLIYWILQNVVEWLVAWPGKQDVRVQLVRGFNIKSSALPGQGEAGWTFIDLFVSHDETYGTYRLWIQPLSFNSLRLRIEDPDKAVVWEDAGSLSEIRDRKAYRWRLERFPGPKGI